MGKFNHWVRRLTGVVTEDIPVKGVRWLFLPGVHAHMLSTRRAELILSRTRIIAALFTILTCLWVAVDFAFLPSDIATRLAYGRVVASVTFALLALSFRGSNSLNHAYFALVILFAVPTAFYIYSFLILNTLEGNVFAGNMLSIYAILPVVVLAGISIFPLTALEALVFALPVLVIVPIASYFNIDLINITTGLGAFWLLVMVAVVASISGVSQLGFMVSLMGQAMRDPLTKCFSRLSIEELLELQFILSSRNQAPLALAFIDLDHFKSINDNFGHESGDTVLNTAASMMRNILRSGDMLGRWGGEEFILIFPNTTMEQALLAIQRMQHQGLGMRPEGKPVTASIGLAERTIDHASNWRDLVEIADKRMYQAKESGRNRVADHQQVIENAETANYSATPSNQTS
jgi:diguanylate cyclase (GGDEF)-like protein